jgi:hypothetical protein
LENLLAQVVAEEGEEEMMIEEEAKEKFEKTLTAVEQNFNTVRQRMEA